MTIRDRELYFTPLLTAIASDCDLEMLQTFHSYKADLTVLDKSERSAFFLAAQFNRKKMLEVYIALYLFLFLFLPTPCNAVSILYMIGANYSHVTPNT